MPNSLLSHLKPGSGQGSREEEQGTRGKLMGRQRDGGTRGKDKGKRNKGKGTRERQMGRNGDGETRRKDKEKRAR